MFNKKQRVISFLLIIALLLSLCPLAILSTAQASEDTFSPEKHYFDFSQYEFDTVTLEELAVFNSYKATTVNAYNATKNVGFWSLENDSNVTGGKYLKYVKDNNGNNGGLFNFLFVANATGNYQTNEKDKHIVLKANTPYSIKIRYKIENLEEEKYDLNLFAVATQGVATPNSCPAGNLVYIKEGLGNTDGWTEATYSFVTPETYLGNNNSLLLGFNPAKEGTTTRPSEGTKFTYSVSVDCVEINRLSTVRLNGVDSTGHKTTENIYGAVGDKINFPDKGAVIYGNYDEDTKAFLNPIDVANRFFANSVYEDFYYKDDTFDIESYNIDFSQYNLIVGFTASLKYPGYNALAINMQTNSFSEVKEIRALIDSVTVKRIADDDVVCMTNTLTGPDYVIGKKDEKITLPNDLKLDGYKFLGWFMDKNYGLEVADALFSEDTVFYAKWARVKFTQDFEEYDYQGYGIGYDLDVEYYNNKVSGYNSKNVYSGSSSIHRIGKVSSDKKFTLITDANDKIAIGETYKVTYYVKLLSTKNEDQNIYVLPTDSYFYPGACDTDMAIPSVSLKDLYPGVWYKITNIVTLYSPYLAVKTPGLSDIYFDNFTMELVSSDTVIDEDKMVVPLGKVPETQVDEGETEYPDIQDTVVNTPIIEDTIIEDIIVEDIPIEEDNVIEDGIAGGNGEGTDEPAPQENKVDNNISNEKSSNHTVVIVVISILAAVLVVAAILTAIYLKKRKVK